MIIRRAINTAFPNVPSVMTLPELLEVTNMASSSGQVVTPERSKNISTAYRCINVLSDDVAKMPLQTFVSRAAGQITRVQPSNRMMMNIAWLLELSPNRWMTPLIFKKALIQWLLCYGNAYAWKPVTQPGQRPEIYILPANVTIPLLDMQGNIWYRTQLSDETQYIPGVEVLQLMINSTDGMLGRSVISYARETLGRQLGAHETQGKFFDHGLNPGGLIWMAGEANQEARAKIRQSYEEAMSGSGNAHRLAVLDNKITKFEPITMKPVDAQFLESIEANDTEIANYFGVPLYKLNSGKQSYQSNEQQNLDYLQTTLDPYLVQFEQAAALRWLSEEEQNYTYFRFNRDVLLRTDAKTRAEYLSTKIQSGQMSPNEARSIDDLPAYEGGDRYYFPSNMMEIGGER